MQLQTAWREVRRRQDGVREAPAPLSWSILRSPISWGRRLRIREVEKGEEREGDKDE